MRWIQGHDVSLFAVQHGQAGLRTCCARSNHHRTQEIKWPERVRMRQSSSILLVDAATFPTAATLLTAASAAASGTAHLSTAQHHPNLFSSDYR